MSQTLAHRMNGPRCTLTLLCTLFYFLFNQGSKKPATQQTLSRIYQLDAHLLICLSGPLQNQIGKQGTQESSQGFNQSQAATTLHWTESGTAGSNHKQVAQVTLNLNPTDRIQSLNLSPYSKKSRPIFTGDVVACWLDAPASVPNPRLVGPRTVNLIQFCVPPGNQHKPFLRRSVLKGKYGGAEIKNLLTKRRAEPSLKGLGQLLY
ncbi:hypothetical protein B0H16DRAFT_1482511 [Mycena metata]|uniref:Uncharacterized protein n=1 Tax=Mycena metata TaxID=1033252 RepID=A0AAD7M7N3_9AGAR|nr:hypothetical protein B0H16DRAFT_1482511 [Mycena metata]